MIEVQVDSLLNLYLCHRWQNSGRAILACKSRRDVHDSFFSLKQIKFCTSVGSYVCRYLHLLVCLPLIAPDLGAWVAAGLDKYAVFQIIKSFLGEHTSTHPPPLKKSCFAPALNILPLETLYKACI